jgi:ribonuclease E
VQLLLIANPSLETPNYSMRRVRDDQTLLPENTGVSYELTTPEGDLLEDALKMTTKKAAETAAVTGIAPAAAAPAPAPKPAPAPAASAAPASSGGLLGFIKRLFVGDAKEAEPERPSRTGQRRSTGGNRDSNRSGGQQSRGRGNRRGGSGRNERKEGGRGNSNRNNSNRNKRKPANASGPDDEGSKPEVADNRGNKPEAADNRGNQQPRNTEESGAPKRRRRRRRRPSDKQDGSTSEQQVTDKSSDKPAAADSGDVNGNVSRPASESSTDNRRSGSAQPARKAPASSAETAAPAAPSPTPDRQAAASNDSAASAGKTQSGDSGEKPKASGDKDRLLPWESKASDNQSKPYKVWSSDESNERD